jgi:hypothetical protein
MDFLKTRMALKLFLCFNLTFICVLTTFLLPAEAQGPPFPFSGSTRGQEAITVLGERLPAVAQKYGKSPKKLKQIFLNDNDLWLDDAENLLFLCTFETIEAEIPPESADSAIPTGPFPLEQTFQLHSLAGASKIIYLDFDGHVTSGTIWNSNFNGSSDIISVPYDFDGNTGFFSDAEKSRIQKVWARVAEDFAMYNIDGDANYGIRVVISPSSSWYGNAGGVAYIGSFDWGSDTPTFVFSNKLGNGNEKYVAEATSHETGHTLGLIHDGTTSGTTYYSGHGNWAPIMGVGYYKSITQWSKGEYAGANNSEDDLAVMLNNGASYRQDDHGDWIDNATWISGDSLDASGIIERTEDMDVFGFQTEAGDISITVEPANLGPNLDILMQVLDDGGNIINEDEPYNILPASLNISVPAGTYYILIDGVGTGDPNTGYSDYSSIGQYFISGTLAPPQFPPAAPADLSAIPISESQINLSWTDNSTNENGFSIERSPNGDDSWAEINFTAANMTSYSDTGLSHETPYHYRVSAYNVVGSSGHSNNASATTFDIPPASPSNLSATSVSSSQIDLVWSDNSNNENGFIIQRSPNGDTGWEEIATVIGSNSYNDTGLSSGTTNFYRVAAYNDNGTSKFSNSDSATTLEVLPESPTNLSAIASSSTQIDLSWQDTSSNEAGFKVERSPDGLEWTEIAALPNDSTNFSDTLVSSGTTYYYRVFSHNSAGASGYSNTAEATTDELPQFIDQSASQEAAVAGTLSGTFMDTHANDSVVESITERTSGGKPQNRYSYLEHKWIIQVQAGTSITLFANAWASVSSEGDTFVFSYATDDENYIDMFSVSNHFDDDSYHMYLLPASLSGTIYIRATDTLRSAGSYDKDTLYLDHLFIRTDNEPETLPLSPSNLTAAAINSASISLSWTDNTDNELGFNIERSADGTNWEQIGSTGSDVVTFTDTGLDPGMTFNYQVQAFNFSGVSGYSNSASATTAEADALHVESISSLARVNRNRWDASVTTMVHDQNNTPIVGATVEGTWGTGGSSNCITDQAGQCTVTKSRLKTSIASTIFSVTWLAKSGYIYDPGSNVKSTIEVFSP